MIKLSSIFCKVRADKELFNNASVDFDRGIINIIAGANGTGKSTLLNIIRGHTSGYYAVSGTLTTEVHSFNVAHTQRPRIGYVVQRYRDMLVPTMTVAQNLAAARMNHNPGLSPLPSTDDLQKQLTLFNISGDRIVQSLSGGQQQILAIIMTLAHQVEILLLDEPTAALDEENTQLVVQFLHNLVQQQQCTVIMVTHDQNLLTPATYKKIVRIEEVNKNTSS